MYTFRFNPVFRQWVLLGHPLKHDLSLEPAHLLHSGSKGDFLASVNPQQPFIMDPPSRHGTVQALHREEPPVGEYELLLYSGKKALANWGAPEWEQWLELLQKRILHLHHNPHLHHTQAVFSLAWQDTVGAGYKRVGDLIATSHPVAGDVPLLDSELVEKLRRSERGYILHDGDDGMIYSPSAPLFEKEIWYVPFQQEGAIERANTMTRVHTSEALALIMKGLLSEWPQEKFIIELHTTFVTKHDDATWWIRIYQQGPHVSVGLSSLPLPEKFVRDLSYLLGPGRPS